MLESMQPGFWVAAEPLYIHKSVITCPNMPPNYFRKVPWQHWQVDLLPDCIGNDSGAVSLLTMCPRVNPIKYLSSNLIMHFESVGFGTLSQFSNIIMLFFNIAHWLSCCYMRFSVMMTVVAKKVLEWCCIIISYLLSLRATGRVQPASSIKNYRILDVFGSDVFLDTDILTW